jgi:hypothetical protein
LDLIRERGIRRCPLTGAFKFSSNTRRSRAVDETEADARRQRLIDTGADTLRADKLDVLAKQYDWVPPHAAGPAGYGGSTTLTSS